MVPIVKRQPDPKAVANQMAELHRQRFESYSRDLAEQAIIHQKEVSALAAVLQSRREALRDAIRLLDATRRNEWTPADTKRLEEIRATAS
jgi:hypothetical protein